ncbi:MAG: PHP domain-containing protein [Candidatus Hydrogenedentes bacterium]|nr:PHP domain-containing protein [Candidatus Hydrogenedentota bacterium]
MVETVENKKTSWLRLILRWAIQFVAVVVVLGAIVLAIVCRGALYNRFVVFPKQAAAWEAIRAARQEVILDDGWTEYRGVCHSHSELSHDSEMKFPDILRAAKIADISFICMTDHAREGKADYSWGWKGLHENVLFVRGFELGHGFMPWGLPDDTVFSTDADLFSMAEEIAAKGGVLFFAHSEEEREWELPQLTGMEIYNLHTDVKDEGEVDRFLKTIAPDLLLSLNKYPDQTFRLLFDRQTDILKHWDDLNAKRKIVGIAASDAHQNSGIQGFYTEDGKLQIRDTGPDKGQGGGISLNFFTRGLLRLFFGPLEPGRRLFRIEMDKYDRSLRFVNTHILANELTEAGVLDALRAGRVFIAFDMLADARGFTFLAESSGAKAVMGEEIPVANGLTLRAASPVPCRFTLVHNGNTVEQKEGRTYEFAVTEPGNYRVEAELSIVGEWTPWAYTNPIRVTPQLLATPTVAS